MGEVLSTLKKPRRRGVHREKNTFFDTAEVYGPFTNEELLGEALSAFRGQVVIAAKFGFKHDPNKGPIPKDHGARGSVSRKPEADD